MSIYEQHPTIETFKANELNTLEFLTTRPMLKNFSNLQSKIQQYYYDFKGIAAKPSSNFLFEADFDMLIEKSSHRVFIGAKVKGAYSECSYFLAIMGKDADENKVIRKFHFDYALPTANTTEQPVPIYHLQYGGKLPPTLEDMSDEKLDCWLSLPRLNFMPVNLAILLDILFCEMRTPETNEIVESRDWRTLIYRNELFLCSHYYSKIHEHISSQNYKKDKLIRDFCYGNA